jgi:hypothetical protein
MVCQFAFASLVKLFEFAIQLKHSCSNSHVLPILPNNQTGMLSKLTKQTTKRWLVTQPNSCSNSHAVQTDQTAMASYTAKLTKQHVQATMTKLAK